MKHFDDLELDAVLNHRATKRYKWDNMESLKENRPSIEITPKLFSSLRCCCDR